jgi:hypothetical protein
VVKSRGSSLQASSVIKKTENCCRKWAIIYWLPGLCEKSAMSVTGTSLIINCIPYVCHMAISFALILYILFILLKVWLTVSWEVTQTMKKAVIFQFLPVSIWDAKDLRV